jgi:PKD repeat protein
VTFTDTSTGSITNWSWTFGDGGTTNVTTTSVAHLYNTPGVYSVTEVVSGVGGGSTTTATNYITVLTPPTLPTVQVTQGAGSVVLTWPTPTMPYHLISAPTPLGPWSPDPDVLSTNGGSVTATIPLTSTQYYYRLQGQ